MNTPKINDKAPDFELLDQEGEQHRLSDYLGQVVVLVFYPFDFSGVCSEEHACIVDAMSRFNRLEAQVMGISVDHKHAHAAFARQQGIEYPLLADFHPKGAVGAKYGVYMADKGHHKRWTFVIDPEGRIAEIVQSEVPEVPEIEDMIAAVEDAV